MPSSKPVQGVNDLKTKFPDIAKEADGWDPSQMTAGSKSKKQWKCKKGHTWNATITNRTLKKSGCPYCANKKVLSGFNDLKTKFPEIAKEADGWDPKKIFPSSHIPKQWKCKKGHIYNATPHSRTVSNSCCPYCSNSKCLEGFNDLKTKFPDIAQEANGWNPSTVVPGSSKKLSWKCKKGHVWKTTPFQRTGRGNGCPVCSETGFNPEKPAWFYLMQRTNEQQFGISNHIDNRLDYHSSKGWQEIESTGPHDGFDVERTEKELKKWLRNEIGLIEGTTENWYTTKMKVNSLSELKEKSGIETSIF